MAMSIGQKSVRVINFLRGLTNRRVVGPLMLFGFTQADMDEGWRLFQAATGTKLAKPRYQAPDPTVLTRLDEWENRWYPVAQATLERHFPDVAERVFLNLAQATGVEVAVSVGTFVARLRQLERDEAERSREARALLAKRGLTEAVIAEPEALLGRFQTMPEPAPEEPEEEDRSVAEDAMWAWYLEWSTIARQAITERGLLRSLGFLRIDRGGDDDAEVEVAQPTAPSAVVTAGPAAAAPAATASPV